MADITEKELNELVEALRPLIGVQLDILRIPFEVLAGFEPSQIGTIVGTLMDASIPLLHLLTEHKELLANLGLAKHEGILKDREGYPDYLHKSGKRLELKLLYVDPVNVKMKKPSTPREPSARLTQKVTVKNVVPERDALLVIAYQLQPAKDNPVVYVATIIDIGIFSTIECIRARDKRLEVCGGRWFGNYETPAILSKVGRAKIKNNIALDHSMYGRKESEGRDYNEDTNFGKLNRIPYSPLQKFLASHSIPNDGEESADGGASGQ